jgi:hypothetical protein
MQLTSEQQGMLDGQAGRAVRKAMEILVALGRIYGAERLIPVTSVQIAGVSYDNLGDAGLQFLADMAEGGGKARVLATLNPAGMDVENWQALGIDPIFAERQMEVIDAYSRMGIVATCTCTPYLSGNVPHCGEHIAWAESSAVCYANSVIGARTNREGGPSALAAALTGLTPDYGFHRLENRRPDLTIQVQARLEEPTAYGALGWIIGKRLEARSKKAIPYLTGIPQASLEELKSLCASLATYGGAALFHIAGVTPEAAQFSPPVESVIIGNDELAKARISLGALSSADGADFISLGCPHLSISEMAHLADLLRDRIVTREFWVTTSRPVKQIADRMGYTRDIEASGARIAADTCCVVAPIRGRFHTLVTDSAKACYYAVAKNKFNVVFKPFDEVVAEALK